MSRRARPARKRTTLVGTSGRTIAESADGAAVETIDQTRLPHTLEVVRLETLEDAAKAIETMVVRGAPLIGATAAYGVWLAVRYDYTEAGVARAAKRLLATRPTAVNLAHAVAGASAAALAVARAYRADAVREFARALCDADVAANAAIGRHGLPLLEAAACRGGGPVQVLTHCNAGRLATVDGGTALAPVYAAFDAGVPVHVWVSETRPRNQGARLTAWELAARGVPATLLSDSACGPLLQAHRADVVLVGADRVTATGDVANKVGTYLKALAARDADVPFHVAAPSTTIDWAMRGGAAVPIEERDAAEVTAVEGRGPRGRVVVVDVAPRGARAVNPAFDVTPARLVTGIVTERGRCAASEAGLRGLFPEAAGTASRTPARAGRST